MDSRLQQVSAQHDSPFARGQARGALGIPDSIRKSTSTPQDLTQSQPSTPARATTPASSISNSSTSPSRMRLARESPVRIPSVSSFPQSGYATRNSESPPPQLAPVDQIRSADQQAMLELIRRMAGALHLHDEKLAELETLKDSTSGSTQQLTTNMQSALREHEEQITQIRDAYNAFQSKSRLIADKTVEALAEMDDRMSKGLDSHAELLEKMEQRAVLTRDIVTRLAGTIENRLRLVEETGLAAEGLDLMATLKGHEGPVLTVELAQLSPMLYTGSYDKTIKIWDLADYQCKHTLTGHSAHVKALHIRDGDTTLFSGSGDFTVRMWDLSSLSCLKTLQAHTAAVLCLASTNNTVFSGSQDLKIKVWDVESCVELASLEQHEAGVQSLVIADGLLFSAADDKEIRAWDPRTFQPVFKFTGHRGHVKALAARNGTLYSGSYDGTVRAWDITTRRLREEVHVDDNGVFCIATTRDRLFVGAHTPHIFALRTHGLQGAKVCLAKGHTSSVHAMTVYGGRLISGSSDHTVKVWN
eukprot:TRINITY_DN5252_c0_g1_i1.p1 TRINITY_DN5252_c0_g1~~TRINITY_DN5252_c0_g1_i1.p1  ORF type:complete len:576 (-),score=133.82 TRINITY_DN5252_c0_g1_i1:273-1862(-)